MSDLSALERAVLNKLLDGDDLRLEALRAQARVARVSSREFTGVGFFSSLDVPEGDASPLGEIDLQLHDVGAEIEGLEHGAGFVLFVRSGRLDTLEGFTYDEPWPERIERFQLRYHREPRSLAALDGR